MEGKDAGDVQEASAGASATYQVQCSSLRENGFVMINARPCQIKEMNTSPTGKHGHAKVHLVALDVFTNEKYEDLYALTHNIDVPNVNSSDFEVIDISDDGLLTLVNDKGDARDGLRLPEGEMGQKIKDEYGREDNTVIVTVMSAVGEEAISAFKSATIASA